MSNDDWMSPPILQPLAEDPSGDTTSPLDDLDPLAGLLVPISAPPAATAEPLVAPSGLDDLFAPPVHPPQATQPGEPEPLHVTHTDAFPAPPAPNETDLPAQQSPAEPPQPPQALELEGLAEHTEVPATDLAPGAALDDPAGLTARIRAELRQSAADAAAPQSSEASDPANAAASDKLMFDLNDNQALEHHLRFAQRIQAAVTQDQRLAVAVRNFRITRDAELDRRQRNQLEDLISPHVAELKLPLRSEDREPVFNLVYDELLGLGPLGKPWRDDSITEIMVDAWDKISVERAGRIYKTNLTFRDREHALSTARDLSSKVSDRTVSPTNALVNAVLDGARVNIAYMPIVQDGLAITIRKSGRLMDLAALLDHGALTDEMVAFFSDVVTARANVMVSGGTGTGKTTLVNALSRFIPNSDRVVVIEDTRELELASEHVVYLQTKERSSADDPVAYNQAELLKNSLRMRPDRLIIGEIRDPHAAAVMMMAANTGHDGTMTTVHANTAEKALNQRLAGLVRAGSDVPDDVAKADISEVLDLVVHGERTRGRRFVSGVVEVDSAMLTERGIKANVMFQASMGLDGEVEFRRTGDLTKDGTLAHKMIETGIDPSPWWT